MNRGQFSSRNTAHAALTAIEVQSVRDLCRAGFRSTTIAHAFRVCERTVRDIIKGRTWKYLPDNPVELPVLPLSFVNRLQINNVRKLTAEQKKQLREYRARLELSHEQEAQREGQSIQKLRWWTDKVNETCGAA